MRSVCLPIRPVSSVLRSSMRSVCLSIRPVSSVLRSSMRSVCLSIRPVSSVWLDRISPRSRVSVLSIRPVSSVWLDRISPRRSPADLSILRSRRQAKPSMAEKMATMMAVVSTISILPFLPGRWLRSVGRAGGVLLLSNICIFRKNSRGFFRDFFRRLKSLVNPCFRRTEPPPAGRFGGGRAPRLTAFRSAGPR